jgi:hypothetical protein
MPRGTFEYPWSASRLASLAWPFQPHYGGGPPWARTVLGNALHEWLARYLRTHRDGGERPELSRLAGIYRFEVERQVEVRYGKGQTPESIVEVGQSILTACLPGIDELLKEHEVVAVEAGFRFELGGWWFHGILDLGLRHRKTRTLTLFDWKTGGSFDGDTIITEHHPQHHMYAIAATQADEWSERIGYHMGRMTWPTDSTDYLMPLHEWPATFFYAHLTPQGITPWPAITFAHTVEQSQEWLLRWASIAAAAGEPAPAPTVTDETVTRILHQPTTTTNEGKQMGLLNKASQGAKPAPRRIMIYGTHGIGKDTLAACTPNPLVLDIEDGTADIEYYGRLTHDDGLESFDDVLGVVQELLDADHDYETLVISTLDWLERWIWDKVCAKHNVASIELAAGGYGKGYLEAVNHWRDLLAGLDALRKQRDMHIVLLAHCKITRFESPESEGYDRYTPKLQDGKNISAAKVLMEWCDEVLFASYKVHTRTSDEKNGKRALGIGTGERVLRCVERPAHIAKNRLGLPDELPLDWDALAPHIYGEAAAD